jgi:glycosyltransferase involved in cell wall biosynthesis
MMSRVNKIPPKSEYNVHVAYICQSFPDTTLTFIAREIEAIRRLGTKVSIIANRQPPEPSRLGELAKYLSETTYIQPISYSVLIYCHIKTFLRRPATYVRQFSCVLHYTKGRYEQRIRALKLFAGSAVVSEQIRKQGAQHMHAHFTANAATLAYFASQFTGVPYSITAHNTFMTDTLLLVPKLRAASFLAVISDYARNYLISRYPDVRGLADKLKVVRCGIYASEFVSFATGKQEGRSKTAKIVSVAQLVPRKGFDILLRALKHVSDAGYNYRCQIIGDGPEKAALDKLANELGVADSVEFVGRVPLADVRAALVEADVFCLACRRTRDGDEDGIPVALMEAMATGVPCISTRVAGIPELVEDRITGLLAEDGDVEQLSAAICELIDNGSLGSDIIARARSRIEHEFDIDVNAEKLNERFLLSGAEHGGQSQPIDDSEDRKHSGSFAEFELLVKIADIGEGVFVRWSNPKTSHRSQFLAQQLSIPLVTMAANDRRIITLPFRYIQNSIRTLYQLREYRPKSIFVQNPPVFLAMCAWLYSRNRPVRLYMDNHTAAIKDFKWRWSLPFLQKMSKRNAVNIFTTDDLADQAGFSGPGVAVLTDPPAVASNFEAPQLKTSMMNVMVVCSGSSDEPLQEILSVATKLPGVLFFLTGGLQSRPELRGHSRRTFDNVVALEYMPDRNYFGLMNAVDCVICLTTREDTLLSGAQEALWIGKPIITSKTDAMSEFLKDIAIFVDNDADSLRSAIETLRDNYAGWTETVNDGRKKKIRDYENQLAELLKVAKHSI